MMKTMSKNPIFKSIPPYDNHNQLLSIVNEKRRGNFYKYKTKLLFIYYKYTKSLILCIKQALLVNDESG